MIFVSPRSTHLNKDNGQYKKVVEQGLILLKGKSVYNNHKEYYSSLLVVTEYPEKAANLTRLSSDLFCESDGASFKGTSVYKYREGTVLLDWWYQFRGDNFI